MINLLYRRSLLKKYYLRYSSSSQSEFDGKNYYLSHFNYTWQYCLSNIPFYQYWKQEHKLPNYIESMDDYFNFPALTKRYILDNQDLVNITPNSLRLTTTGGTSGITTSFPMNAKDSNDAWAHAMLGRKLNGINTNSRLLLVWGHSHLYSDKNQIITKYARKLKDYFSNIQRVSAYDLDEANLSRIINRITKFKPDYIIGYGSVLLTIAHFIIKNKISVKGICHVINTSESLSINEAKFVSDSFGASIINEYGMAEAGVLGYSVGSFLPINLFYRENIFTIENKILNVTTLSKGAFPLINYSTEDIAISYKSNNKFITSLSSLDGKERAVLEIIDSHNMPKKISVVLLDHIIKYEDLIPYVSYQVSNDKKEIIILLPIEYERLLNTKSIRERIFRHLNKSQISIDYDNIRIKFLDSPFRTIAGKRQPLT